MGNSAQEKNYMKALKEEGTGHVKDRNSCARIGWVLMSNHMDTVASIRIFLVILKVNKVVPGWYEQLFTLMDHFDLKIYTFVP